MQPYPLAFHNGRRDMERVGLFAEMPYLLGHYVPPINGNVNVLKGAQMLSEYPKSKCATMDGYFSDKFERILTGEAYYNKYAVDAEERKKQQKFVLNGYMYPPAPAKKHSCPGDYFGNFQAYTALSPLERPKTKKEHPLPNCKTNPGKKGGPGYIDITINKYPEYKSSPYAASKELGKSLYEKHMKGILAGPFNSTIYSGRYFGPDPYFVEEAVPTYITSDKKRKFEGAPFMPTGPAKWDGGCKAGGFDSWPSHSNDPYEGKVEKKSKIQVKPINGPIYPTPPTRSMYTTSVMQHNVKFRVNNRNRHTVDLVVYK